MICETFANKNGRHSSVCISLDVSTLLEILK